MPLDQTALVLIGVLLAAWTLAAAIAVVSARMRHRSSESGRRNAQRFARMIDDSPAIPLLVRADGRIEAPQRLAQWLGLDQVPQYLTELDDDPRGLPAEQLAQFAEAVRRTQKTAAPFRMVLTPRGSQRSLALRGYLADPQVSPGGAALVWVFDFSDSESELVQLRQETARARDDFAALVALIEAAPMPMWFRIADGNLQLVNAAYVAAVAGESAQAVVAAGTELVETIDGQSPRAVALGAAASGQPVERQVMITIDGQRRAFRISDLPLGEEGVAGYAIDVEELEELARTFRAFHGAQRSTLDHLSAGVAQFDAQHQLIFANRPFRQTFALENDELADPPSFERVLDDAREAGRVPEARDFSEWRAAHAAWFEASEAIEEAWPLRNGQHLRMVGQPVPDGGLLLIAEDRTEQLRLSATRDTLLRTRAATFDSLFESVAAFAPDGRIQLWNRRFAADWGLASDFLDTHPRIEQLLEKIAGRLRDPAEARSLGDAVRVATLDRVTTSGRLAVADERTFEYAGVPLPDGNGLLIVLDVTDSQKAEDAWRDRNAALEEAGAMRARFIAEMSHEFRMPVSVIGGFAERLEAGIGGELNDTGKDYVAAILASVDSIGEQTDRLLEVSRAEAGVPPLREEVVEVMAFARQLVEAREAQVAEAALKLDLRGNALIGRIRADPVRLARAIGSLLDHAIATTGPGGRILFEISRQRREGRTYVRIVVSDNGPGMDAATLERVMGGVLVASGASAGDEHLRLGMPLAREIIEAHGGSLELVSEPGEGTAAIVELP